MGVVLLGHVLGDFYFQSNKLSKLKNKSNVYLGVHSLIYTITVSIFIILTMEHFRIYISVIIFATHFVTDKVKSTLENNKKIKRKDVAITFILDQIIHSAVLYAIIMKWTVTCSSEFLFTVLSVLICGKPAAIFIAKVFESITFTSKQDSYLNAEEMKGDIANAGYWIGILEREIILFLGLAGEYSAIGFVLAAKSLARHKNFNEEGFAEKYLIGTLLSSLIAFCCVALCKI